MVSDYQSIFPVTPELAAAHAAFPAWLRDNSARPTEWVIRHDTAQGFTASTAQGDRRTNESVYDLYYDISTNEASATVVFDLALFERGDITAMVYPEDDRDPDAIVDEDDDEIVYAAPPVQYAAQGNTATMIVFPRDSRFVMFAGSFAGWIRDTQEDFDFFATARQDYLQNPNDFELAYTFVHQHPMGWIKTIPEEKNRELTNWTPNSDLHLTPHFVTHDGTKSVEWELEYGEHVEPEYRTRYLDTDLSVYNAPSPEAAYITLAARIEQKYHPNGVEKEQNTHD